jgi:hypothetical protein
LNKIQEIKQSNQILEDKLQQLKEAIKTNAQLFEQNALLISEKDLLKQKIKALTNKYEVMQNDYNTLKENYKEQETLREELDKVLTQKKYDIASLDVLIKMREDLYYKEECKYSSASKDLVAEETDLLLYSDIIFIPNQKLERIFIYHFGTGKSSSFEIKKHEVFSNFGAAQIRDSLYIGGGFNFIKGAFSQSTIKVTAVDFTNIKIESKTDMILPNSSHKFLMLDIRTIYSIGGTAKHEKHINTCESYDIGNNTWKVAASLNETRVNVGAVGIDCRVIYVFGGLKGGNSNFIESLDILTINSAWQIIKSHIPEHFKAEEGLGCYQASDNEVMIFGGT